MSRHCIALIAVVVAGVQPLLAEDFGLYGNGVGPLIISSQIEVKKKVATLHATATNNSGTPIRRARFCAVPRGHKECGLTFWTVGVWQPGQTVHWDNTVRVLSNWQKYDLEVVQLVQDSKLFDVKKVYVDLLDGDGDGMPRDQVMALIANSGRFELVESREAADAILKGRARSREAGTAYTSAEQGAALGVGTAATRLGIAGAVLGSRSTTTAQGVTQTIVAESMVARLVSAAEENLWAWDDTKPCVGPKAKCVIDDLISAAAPPF
jgi:hypothetical protein